jgi:hypothetical protein
VTRELSVTVTYGGSEKKFAQVQQIHQAIRQRRRRIAAIGASDRAAHFQNSESTASSTYRCITSDKTS